MAETKATPAEPLFSFRKDDLVTILVGPGEEEFAVHEHVVTRSSEFFKAAMKKEWTEGQARIIKLPEETHVQNFIHYLNFTYREQLHTEQIKAGDAYGLAAPWLTWRDSTYSVSVCLTLLRRTLSFPR
jgi:hypothetical protein